MINTVIECDTCGEQLVTDAPNTTYAKEEAKARGWVINEFGDKCSECALAGEQ